MLHIRKRLRSTSFRTYLLYPLIVVSWEWFFNNGQLAAVITVATVIWFQLRVQKDERRLSERFGQPYLDCTAQVKRWIPGLF